MKPRSPIASRNYARAVKKFKRNFHSKRRVLWVQGLRCAFCGRRPPSENAHMEARKMGGAGGTYETILPLCRDCHERFDLGKRRFLDVMDLTWADVEARLAVVKQAWAQLQGEA